MENHEIFKDPLVKQVIFQIRFPNLFFMENKIGELQTRIMEKFPESQLLFRRQFSMVDAGPDTKIEEIVDQISKDSETTGLKIWQFISKEKVKLSVLNNSLDIVSDFHKTYNQGNGYKFRDIIKFVLDNFIEITKIPIIKRIGLRYINECSVSGKNKKDFSDYYNSIFPFKKFKLEDSENYNFRIVTKKGKHFLIYYEELRQIKDEYKLILDFDSYDIDISPDKYLDITDKLHDIISDIFNNTINEPVKKIMRKEKEK